MSDIDVSKCELVDCWFYIDHTPPKGQGNWCGAIHKGACKLNSTDCKDTPIERCLIKSLYEQLQQLKAENEDLKQECDLYKTWYRAKHDDLKNFLGQLKTENGELKDSLGLANGYVNKYKQCLDEVEEIAKGMFGPYTDVYELSEHLLRVECKRILNKIKEVKDNE